MTDKISSKNYKKNFILLFVTIIVSLSLGVLGIEANAIPWLLR